MVIEILSPDQTIKQLENKAKDYLVVGVLRVWLVDSEEFNIKVFLPDGTSQVYTDNTPIVDILLPGLQFTTKQIFEEAELI